MKEVELRSLQLNVSKTEDDDFEVQGYIASNSVSHILGKTDGKRWREVIMPGVFDAALSKARMREQDIDFLIDHDKDKILASTANESLYLEEDETGLYIDARISPTSWGKDLYVLVKDGIIKGLSFGMKVLKDSWTYSNDGIPLRTILDIDLFEISALKVPAYPTTLLEARGINLVDVNIPDDIENRDLGGSTMNDEQDIKPIHLYNGLTLIAEKLDIIIQRIDNLQESSISESLEDAKRLLSEAKATVDTVAEMKKEVVVEEKAKEVRSLDKSEELDDLEEDKANEDETEPVDPKDEKSEVIENDESEEKLEDEDVNDEETREETADVEDKEETTEAEETPEEKSEEDEEVEKNDQVEEYRNLIKTLKMEVPEIE